MALYLIPRSDMCMTDPMPFCQHWEARVSVPIASIDNVGAALRDAYDALKAGDLVNISAFEDKMWLKLTESAAFRVVSCIDKRVQVVQVSPTVIVRPGESKQDSPPEMELSVIKVRGAYEVRDPLNNTLDAFVDEEQAKSYVRVAQNPSSVKIDEGGKEVLTVSRGFGGKFIVRNSVGALVREFPNKTQAEEFVSGHAN